MSDHGHTVRTRTPSCKEAPVCPVCDSLQCLCRPRFFAGQLLSEEDLNRLDRYILDKNRLQNRHLHGTGVVCGLEVTCHPCSNVVRVSPGYALGPCGDDIVVCATDTVDVCALINACRDKERRDLECAPYGYTPDCEGVEEDWVLAVRYEERPSRGIAALRGGGCEGDCSCGCNCGKPGGRCTCGETKASPTRARRSAPAECEPTVVCESYRYEVFRAPEQEPEDPAGQPGRPRDENPILAAICELDGALAEKLCCCWTAVFAAVPKMPGDLHDDMTAAERNAWYQWCCRVKEGLIAYLTKHPGSRCSLIAEVQAVLCPAPSLAGAAFRQVIERAQLVYALALFQALMDCLCSALLPACPEPVLDPRVPLATVRVRRRECTVLSVCNWTPLRKHVITFPTLGYWFGWLPQLGWVRDVLHKMCCDLFGLRDRLGEILQRDEENISRDQPVFTPREDVGLGLSSGLRMRAPYSTAMLGALLKARSQPMTPALFTDALLGRQPVAGGVPESSPEALAGSPQVQLLRKVLKAQLSAFAPPELVATALGAGIRPTVGLGAPDVDELRQEMAAMRDQLERQDGEIAELRRQLDR